MTLRIYADFNSGGPGWCWCLRYGNEHVPLDDVADELGLTQGQSVIVY
jgi:hypothetical protein